MSNVTKEMTMSKSEIENKEQAATKESRIFEDDDEFEEFPASHWEKSEENETNQKSTIF